MTPAAAGCSDAFGCVPQAAYPFGTFLRHRNQPYTKGTTLWFPGSAVIILGYFSADVAHGWEGAALTGCEIWHPCIPLEPGNACHGWYGPRQS